MSALDKRSLSERDICSKFITPALIAAKWDNMEQVREEVSFTKGRVIVRGRLSARGEPKRADYILYHKPGIPLAVIEAKDNTHSVGAGMQQALDYATTIDVRRRARPKLLRTFLSKKKLKELDLLEFARERPPPECVGQFVKTRIEL